jgi:hypothetical protein
MHDTTLAAEQVRLAAIRGMTPAQRLSQMFQLSHAVRQLAFTGLRERHPDCTDLELVELMLGKTLVPAAARPARP